MAFGTQGVVRFSEPRAPNLEPLPTPFHLLTSARIHVLTKVNVFLSSTDLPTSLLPHFKV